MKATLKFNLDDPSDKLTHKRCLSATDAYLALHSISERLRQLDKYGDEDKVSVEMIRSDFFDILESHDINLDDLE